LQVSSSQILLQRGIAVDSAVIEAIIGAVSAVIVALIGVLGIIYQRTGKLLWWRKPNSSPSKPPVGNHDSLSSYAYDLTERALSSYNQGQYQNAFNYLQQALLVTRQVGDRAGEGTTLSNIGDVYHVRGSTTKPWRTTGRRWLSIGKWVTAQ
jgi:tetratricopeptide (TPR) repeat protein